MYAWFSSAHRCFFASHQAAREELLYSSVFQFSRAPQVIFPPPPGFWSTWIKRGWVCVWVASHHPMPPQGRRERGGEEEAHALAFPLLRHEKIGKQVFFTLDLTSPRPMTWQWRYFMASKNSIYCLKTHGKRKGYIFELFLRSKLLHAIYDMTPPSPRVGGTLHDSKSGPTVDMVIFPSPQSVTKIFSSSRW